MDININEALVNELMLEILRAANHDDKVKESLITNTEQSYIKLLMNLGYDETDSKKIMTVFFQNKFNLSIYTYLVPPSKELTPKQAYGYWG